MSEEIEEGFTLYKRRGKLILQARVSVSWKKASLVVGLFFMVLVLWIAVGKSDTGGFIVEILLWLLGIFVED